MIMQTIDVSSSTDFSIHCPFCGTQIEGEADVHPCPHLVYLGVSETDDPVFGDFKPAADSEGTLVDMLEARYPGNDHILFILGPPPPAGLEVYVLFKCP